MINMNNPSIKTIKQGLKVSDDIAKIIRGLFTGDINPFDYSDMWYEKNEYYIDKYSDNEKKLYIINDLINGYGVESIRGQYIDRYYYDINLGYVNMGDTYTTTVIRDYLNQTWVINSWGNIVESNPKRFEV